MTLSPSRTDGGGGGGGLDDTSALAAQLEAFDDMKKGMCVCRLDLDNQKQG